MTKNNIFFETAEFFDSYGKEPKGGSFWLFKIECDNRNINTDTNDLSGRKQPWFLGRGSLTKAKKQLITYLNSHNVFEARITILP